MGKARSHINPQSLLTKIENENAKIKMLVNSYRDRTFRDDELLANDSDHSKNDVLS